MSTGHVQQHDFAALPPFASKEERFVTEALMMQTAPSAQVAMMRPVVGMQQVPLFRPRYGYETQAITVTEVLSLNRAQDYNTNYTGGAWDINAAARNTGPGWI